VDEDGHYFFVLDSQGVPYQAYDILPENVVIVYTNGGVMTHNHPAFGDFGQSPADLGVGRTLDLAEHRMVRMETLGGQPLPWVYSASPNPVTGWGNFTKSQLEADFLTFKDAFSGQLDLELQDAYGSGTITGSQFDLYTRLGLLYGNYAANLDAAQRYGFSIMRGLLR